MYCVNCGVKLADSEKKCPLCGVRVYHPELKQEEGEYLFPQQRYPNPQLSPRTAQIILTAIFLLPILITPCASRRRQTSRETPWERMITVEPAGASSGFSMT